MPTILDYYEYAKLATAAYANLKSNELSGDKIASAANEQERIPIALAEHMFVFDAENNLNPWVVSPGGYHGNDATGFAATLFQRGSEKVLAIRGTEPTTQYGVDLLEADLAGIGILGLALNQAVEMVNYIRQLSTPTDQQADHLVLHTSLTVPSVPSVRAPGKLPGQSVYFYFSVDRVNGLGLIGEGEHITVTGHSLGGHLAALAARLFPSLVADAYTYNAPGFDPASVQVANSLIPGVGIATNTALISVLASSLGPAVLGLSSGSLQLTESFVTLFDRYLGYSTAGGFAEVAPRIHNLESENLEPGDDVSAVSGVFTNASALTRENLIPTERNSHLIEPMMDSLAMQALLYRLNSTLTLSDITKLYEAASPHIGDTLEKLTLALHKAIVGGDVPEVAVVDIPELGTLWSVNAGDINGRRQYHAALQMIERSIASNPNLQIVPLLSFSAADLNTLASNPEALATRYALLELNPFAVLGVDYSHFNQNGELDLFDPAAGTGTLTQAWLEDRAVMMVRLIEGNTTDRGYGVLMEGPNQQHLDLVFGQAAYALSSARAIELARAARANPGQLAALFQHELTLNRASRLVFGGDEAEIINGGGQTDRLYGGGGDDVLHGAAGADYLEGDAGHDVLIGGTGHDIYAVGGGSGTDIIVDAAEGAEGRQLGEIRFGDTAVAGTFTALDAELKNFTFTAADGQYYASYSGSVQENLAGTLTLWRGDSGARVVQVQNFRSGDLGIVLGGGAPPRIYTDIVGTGEADNDKLDLAMPHEDTLVTTAGAQKVFGLGGADYIVLAHAHTIGYGGAGNDRIIDSTGAQSQYGEDGDDVLLAGAGNDELFGGAGNDALQGGADDDLLDGGDGQDFIDGGIGADVIFGGAGADFILGGGNLTYELKVSFDYYRFATGAYAGLSFADGHPVLPHLVGVDPWTGQYVATGYAFYEGDLGDVIDAGEGDDWVFSGDGADSVLGGSGADYLVGGAGDDYIDGGEDADTILGDGTEGDMEHAPGAFWFYTYPQFHGRDVLSGGGGNDYIRGDGGSDLLFGDDGDDELVGDANQLDVQYHGDDYLDGGAGNDRLFGQGGDDQLVGGDGDDILMGDDSSVTADRHGNDYLDGGAGADLLVGAGGADFLFGGDGDDTLAGDADDVAAEHHGDDYLDGGAGNDYLRGYGGNDTLIGGEGNDELYGEAGNDILVGGPGADLLDGGVGDDTYVFDVQDLHGSPGAMSSVIQDAGGANTLILEGMDLASVSVTQGMGVNGNDLVLTLDDGSRITIGGGAAGAIQSYGTGDGALLAPVDFLDATAGGALNLSVSRNDAFIAGGRGDDHLIVNGTGNTIAGGKGNDLIEVGGSNNTVDYRPGDGVDTLRSLAATGTRPGALTVSRVESQSPRYGDDAMSNDFEWRKAA